MACLYGNQQWTYNSDEKTPQHLVWKSQLPKGWMGLHITCLIYLSILHKIHNLLYTIK